MAKDDELSALPLKSFELGSKTVAKLKPLGAKTVGDLLAHRPEALIALGLVEKELLDIADGASTFGAAWATEDEIRALFAALGGAPSAPAPKVKTAPKPARTTVKPKEAKPLGADLETLYATDAGAPLAPPLSAEEVRAFIAGHLRGGSYHDDAPPDPRFFPLFRRLRTFEAESVGGDVRLYIEALVDGTQLPLGLTSDERGAFAVSMSCDFTHLLKKMAGIETSGGRAGLFQLGQTLKRKALSHAERLVARHRQWAGASKALLLRPQPFDVGAAVRALHDFGEDAEAFAIVRAQPLDPGMPEFDANLRDVAFVFRDAGKHTEGVGALESALAPASIARATRPDALHEAAALLARAGQVERAVDALKRARQVGYDLAIAVEEPDFVPLKSSPAYRRLFSGYPVFEKRLFG